MNGFSDRDAAFLAEMGLAPLWQLRGVAGAQSDAAVADADADAAVADADADAAPEAEPAAQAHPPGTAPASVTAAVTAAAPAAAPDAEPAAQAHPPRTAPASVTAAVTAAAPAAAPADVASPANAPQAASARAATEAPPSPASPPAQPPASGPAPARGPSPLQRVAQSASALEPVAPPASPDAAWDDAALPRDATPDEIAAMDWDQLQLAIAACRRCSACRDGRAPVPGTGARQARWLVAAGASTAADEKARLPLAGDPGKLLDNMLAAVGMARSRDVYITNLIKCRPTTAGGAERAPTSDEAAACRPYLERELALTGAGTVLTLGQIAANTLLGRPLAEPLAGARGQAHAVTAGARALRLVATLHPGELLRRGLDKAQAWADLCRARAAAEIVDGAADGSAGDAPG